MGAGESKSQGSSAGAGEGSSKAKLAFVPGTQPLLTTPVFTLRDAFFGKRPVSAFTYDPTQFVLDNKQEFLPKAIKVSQDQLEYTETVRLSPSRISYLKATALGWLTDDLYPSLGILCIYNRSSRRYAIRLC